MVIIGADIPTEVMLRALKAALELKRQVAAHWLYATIFVRPSAIGSQIFGLLRLTIMEKTCSASAARLRELLPVMQSVSSVFITTFCNSFFSTRACIRGML